MGEEWNHYRILKGREWIAIILLGGGDVNIGLCTKGSLWSFPRGGGRRSFISGGEGKRRTLQEGDFVGRG